MNIKNTASFFVLVSIGSHIQSSSASKADSHDDTFTTKKTEKDLSSLFANENAAYQARNSQDSYIRKESEAYRIAYWNQHQNKSTK